MAADAGIFQQYLNPVRSVADYRGEMDKQEQNALTLAAARWAGQATQQGMADDQAARQASIESSGDSKKFVNALQAAGLYKQAAAAQKSLLDNQESQAKISHFGAQTAESEQKTATGRAEAIGQTLGALSKIPGGATPQHLTNAMQHMVDIGQISPEMAQKIIAGAPADQSQMQGWLLQGQRAVLGVKDQLPKFQTVDTGGAVSTGSVDPVTGTYTPAQSMAKTQTPDSIAANRQRAADAAASREQSDRHFNATQASGKVPAGYRANPDGSMSFIPGGPADPAAGGGKPPTEFQGKSAAFGARAEEADKIISDLEGKYSPTGINSKQKLENTWLVGGALGAATNKFALSDNTQKAEQAQRDFVNAVLRQESGAAIGASEFDNAKTQYFPQPGDGAAVIEQKARNRKLAVQGLVNNAGKAAFHAPAATSDDIHAAADAILRGGK